MKRLPFLPLILVFIAAPLRGQLVPVAAIMNVWGGKAGTIVDFKITGANLNQATQVNVSGGMLAEVTGGDAANVYGKITIPSGTPSGMYEIRILTPGGASSPGSLYFHVSDFPSFNESEPNNLFEQHNLLPTLPVTINGLINGGEDRDFFHFRAEKGQHLVCEAFADRLIRPAGMTPLNAKLTLFNSSGRKVADGSEREPGHTDPLLECDIPADDHYLLEVRDEYYRGANTYFYRVNIGFQPVITSIEPQAVGRGGGTEIHVRGFNLDHLQSGSVSNAIYPPQVVGVPAENPAGLTIKTASASPTEATLRIDTASDASIGARDLRVTSANGTSNAIKLLVLNGTARFAENDNPTLKQAYRLTPPFVVTQHANQLRGPSYFVFKAKQGERWIIEVFGRRLLEPVDPFLTLYDANGKELQGIDDSIGADPRIDFNVQQQGENDFYLRVHDLAVDPSDNSSSFILSARPYQPDFAISGLPDNPNVVRGGNAASVQVNVTRMDGYNGPIEITADELPAGVSFAPNQIGSGQNQINLQFKAAADAALGMKPIVLRGKASINDRQAIHELVALSPYQYGAGIALNRPTSGFLLTVVEPFGFSLNHAGQPVNVKQGAKSQTQIRIVRAGNFPGNISLGYSGLPSGVTVTPAATGDNALTVTLNVTATDAATIGTHNITITGSSNVNGQNTQKTMNITLIVDAK